MTDYRRTACYPVPFQLTDGCILPNHLYGLTVHWHNLFNPNDHDVKSGWYFYNTSTTRMTGQGNASWITSGYIPVTPGAAYCFSGNATVRAYDADKNFVKKSWTALYNTANNATRRLYSFHDGIAYVRFSCKTDCAETNADYIQNYAMVYQWTGEFYPYNAYHTAYDIIATHEQWNNLVRSALPAAALSYHQLPNLSTFRWNYINPAEVQNGTLSDTTGEYQYLVDTDTAFYRVCGYTAVSAETEYITEQPVFCYDTSYAFLGKVSPENGTLTPLANTAYIRQAIIAADSNPTFSLTVSGYTRNFSPTEPAPSYCDSIPMFSNTVLRDAFKAYLGTPLPLADQKICFLGDDIFADGTVSSTICTKLGAICHQNTAVTGAGFASDEASTAATAYEQAQALIAAQAAPDYILMVLGANDQRHAHTLGSLIASIDPSDFSRNTFYGGLQACINILQNSYPHAVITLGFTPGLGQELAEDNPYLLAMREVARRYGIRYLDTQHIGITPLATAYAACYDENGMFTTTGLVYIGEYLASAMTGMS